MDNFALPKGHSTTAWWCRNWVLTSNPPTVGAHFNPSQTRCENIHVLALLMLVPSCSTSIRFLKKWQLEHNSRPIFGGLIMHVNCSCSWFNPPHCFKRKSQKKTRTCLTPQYVGSCVTPFVVRRSLLGSGTLHPKLLLAACCAWAMWGWTNTTCGWNQRNEIFFRCHWGCKHFSAPGGCRNRHVFCSYQEKMEFYPFDAFVSFCTPNLAMEITFSLNYQ